MSLSARTWSHVKNLAVIAIQRAKRQAEKDNLPRQTPSTKAYPTSHNLLFFSLNASVSVLAFPPLRS